jgi:hypothetical protein
LDVTDRDEKDLKAEELREIRRHLRDRAKEDTTKTQASAQMTEAQAASRRDDLMRWKAVCPSAFTKGLEAQIVVAARSRDELEFAKRKAAILDEILRVAKAEEDARGRIVPTLVSGRASRSWLDFLND